MIQILLDHRNSGGSWQSKENWHFIWAVYKNISQFSNSFWTVFEQLEIHLSSGYIMLYVAYVLTVVVGRYIYQRWKPKLRFLGNNSYLCTSMLQVYIVSTDFLFCGTHLALCCSFSILINFDAILQILEAFYAVLWFRKIPFSLRFNVVFSLLLPQRASLKRAS